MSHIPRNNQILAEQETCLRLANEGKIRTEIAEITGLTTSAVQRRIEGGRKRLRLDPELAARLSERGLTDLAGLHSGWLLEKDEKGSGHSLYFYLGPDEEKISFADAIKEVLMDIPKLAPIKQKWHTQGADDYATWLMLADLHVGGDYGDPQLEADFNHAIDDLVRRLPPAKHAVLMELGDLLEANDHKGVTPASANPLDVKRGDHLQNMKTAVKLIRRAAYRLLETHDTVELHFIKGNHDPSAYVGVMLALEQHFEENPRINVVVTEDEFRVVPWGDCAVFPHHGDSLKWPVLKDVFADQFAEEWARAKMHRLIATAHFHHDRKLDLVGAVGEHFRTLHRPNGWAKTKGLLSRGSLTAMTVHKTRGEEYRTTSNIRNMIAGK